MIAAHIVLGNKAGRRSARERIVDINFGAAIHDVAVATEDLKRARKKGYGKTLTLVDNAMPFVR